MRNEEFLTKLAKQYTKEAGEKYILENEELAQSPLLGLDKKMKTTRRRQTWQRHKYTFMGVAASIVVIIIAGIAFLPEILREYDSVSDMSPMAAPQATADTAAPPIPASPHPFAAQSPAGGTGAPMQPTPAMENLLPASDEAHSAQRQHVLGDAESEAAEYAAPQAVTGAPPAEPPAPLELDINFGFNADSTQNHAITNFSQNMFNQVLATGEENAVISALSAYYVLAMVAQGAAGQTLAEFDQLLGFSSHALPRELESLTLNLTLPHWDTTLNIAASVWVHDQQTVNTAFNRTMETYFAAPAKSRNFFAPETVPEINQWVHDNTEGLIESIVEELDPDAVMLLVNALYFKGQWANAMHYTPNTFRTEAGESIAMDFISTEASTLQVAQTPQFEAALLPYNCGRFGFLLARPTNGLLVRDFAAAYSFADILASLHYAHATIQMPGLDFAFDIELNDILQNMGLVSAFNFGTADFSELIYTNIPLEISRVLQKVRILVDRYGTEAAAVTAVEVWMRSGRPPRTIDLIFNTPYMYAIVDMSTGIPLFMGVVDNPMG